MSSDFAEYAASSAFRIDLSVAMINVLVLEAYMDDPSWSIMCVTNRGVSTLQCLQRRGLVRHIPPRGGWELTDAGRALIPLLALAGHDIDTVKHRCGLKEAA